jgi:hypothetical protein
MNSLTCLVRAAERGAGGDCPGPQVLGAPRNCLVGPQSFFWVKYFRAKGKIFVFFSKVPKFGIKY